MAHLLKYGSAVNASILRSNPQHNFAHTHALQIYDSGAMYSMIPKNGCTTLRLSIALANGAISDRSEWEWIHQNNDSFRPSFKDLALAAYRFAILRCPYGRLVSCFLDKIVKRTPDAQKFLAASQIGGGLDKLTFRQFCGEMAKPLVRNSNMHWRPQVDFLVYAGYDTYFCFEDFSAIGPVLKARIGLELIDARPMARHDSSHYGSVNSSMQFADVELAQLEAMLLNGFYPAPAKFYDSHLTQSVYSAYQSDFALYERECPGKGLFAGQTRARSTAAAV
jgi:hypothetical protein